MTTRITTPAPNGKERLKALKERLAHEDMPMDERCELADLVAKLSKKAERKDPIAKSCPYCGAGAGHPCTRGGPLGGAVPPHKARRRAS